MSLLFRYQLRELIRPLLAWIAFLFLMLFLLFVLRGTGVLMGTAARGEDLVRLGLYLSPQLLVTCLPIALLLAILFGFGRLAEDGELAALQSLGVSPVQLVKAPLALGLLVIALLVPLSFRAMPWGLVEMQRLANEVILRNVAEGIKPGAFYEGLAGRMLFIEGPGTDSAWRNVFLYDESTGGTPSLILAEAGGSRPSPRGNAIELWLSHGSLYQRRDDERSQVQLDFERARLQVELNGSAMGRISLWGNATNAQTPERILEDAREAERRGEQPRPLRVAFHERVAQTLTPLVFALVGAPLAMGRRGSGRARAFLLAVGAYAAYFVLLRLLGRLALQGPLPEGLMSQLANGAFLLVGASLLLRLSRRGWQG